MREAQTKKIPLTLIVGDKEVEGNTISYRKFGSQDTTNLSFDKFMKDIVKTIKDKKPNMN